LEIVGFVHQPSSNALETAHPDGRYTILDVNSQDQKAARIFGS
jgi:hypothetical protein